MDEAVLDFEEFMDRVQDDKELLFELLDIFIADFEEKRELLHEAIKEGDTETLKDMAHFFKGSCGNISAKSLKAVFIELEEKGKEDDLEGAEKSFKDIEQKFQELVVRVGELRTST